MVKALKWKSLLCLQQNTFAELCKFWLQNWTLNASVPSTGRNLEPRMRSIFNLLNTSSLCKPMAWTNKSAVIWILSYIPRSYLKLLLILLTKLSLDIDVFNQ